MAVTAALLGASSACTVLLGELEGEGAHAIARERQASAPSSIALRLHLQPWTALSQMRRR